MDLLTLTTIATLLPIYRYLLVFIFVIIEGPLITMFVGFLLAHDLFNWLLAFVIIIAAEMVSDSLYYLAGYWGGKKLAEKYANFTKLSEKRLNFLKHIFHNHPRKTLIIGKITHMAGVPILIAAGIIKINWWLFFLYDLMATIPKTLFFLIIGYYLGQLSEKINSYLTYGTIIFSVIIILIFIGYLFIGNYLEKKLIK
ncbi:MAG: hypothetical protein US42_C0002G0012 [Candidatus Magasanikbacteria bacterium GW2011_GWC2_37_14]|uniref:VTT domain-containing protein n=1 Tax=Candidatus Magasanikbacteria bacterium GW2011_GWC2_37_14 TaxID=1619046 RepID=A0A0G0GDG9_9BACT|nr:MAG: hypothetical protein US42_C0002G0012 [Candidatus Magasanikbacteria bacterium GW2011_GWC2_37_14]